MLITRLRFHPSTQDDIDYILTFQALQQTLHGGDQSFDPGTASTGWRPASIHEWDEEEQRRRLALERGDK